MVKAVRLFDPHVVYPTDNQGAYVELIGSITDMSEWFDGHIRLTVQTDKGVFNGYWEGPTDYPEKHLWKYALIRVYDSGGGLYPDNSIRTVSMRPLGNHWAPGRGVPLP